MYRFNAVIIVLRMLLIFLNSSFTVFGFGLVGIGIWLLINGVERDYTVITGFNLLAAVALLVVAGVLTVIISTAGFIGACRMWRLLLILYIAFMVIVLLLEFSAGTIGFLSVNSASTEIESRLYKAINDYRNEDENEYSEEINNIVDSTQNTFNCCGVNSTLDWFQQNLNFTIANSNNPPRDCVCDVDKDSNCMQFNITFTDSTSKKKMTATFYAWDRGCLSPLTEIVTYAAISLGTVSIAIGFLEIFGVFVALLMLCLMKKG